MKQTAVAQHYVQRGRGPRLIPVTQWHEYHAWPPVGGLRHLIFHATANGFESVIRRIGRRVLIDEAAFFEWVNAAKADLVVSPGTTGSQQRKNAPRRKGG